MTLYVLHGGAVTEKSRTNDDFYRLMADTVPEGGLWLGCYFASTAEKEVGKFAEDARKLREVGGHDFRIEMARADGFEAQVRAADVVFFAGGMTRGLMKQVGQWPELAVWLMEKSMVAGSSAGMNLLGRAYLSKDGSRGEGLGLVPFNVLVHHRAKEYAHTQAGHALKPPLLALHEAQFCVLEF